MHDGLLKAFRMGWDAAPVALVGVQEGLVNAAVPRGRLQHSLTERRRTTLLGDFFRRELAGTFGIVVGDVPAW